MHREELWFTPNSQNVFGGNEEAEKWLKEGNDMLQDYIKDKAWVSGCEMVGVVLHHDPNFEFQGDLGFTLE